MALSKVFTNIAASIRDRVEAIGGDTYDLLHIASEANEAAVQHGVEEYDRGYSAGREAEAAKHVAEEPLANWERELLGTFLLPELSDEEFAILYRVIGSHTAGAHPALITLWGKISETASDRTIGLSKVKATGLGATVRVDKP